MSSHYKSFMQWEDAANSVGDGSGVHGIGVGPKGEPGVDLKKKKKKKEGYDGRTREGKKFVERILARRAAKEAKKST